MMYGKSSNAFEDESFEEGDIFDTEIKTSLDAKNLLKNIKFLMNDNTNESLKAHDIENHRRVMELIN